MRTLLKFVTCQTLKLYITPFIKIEIFFFEDSNTCVVAFPSILIDLISFKEHLSTLKATVDKSF